MRLLALLLLLGICFPVAAAARPAAQQRLTIAALGDSVPSGAACRCTPFPELTAADLTRATRRRFAATDDAVSGFSTGDVLHQLRAQRAVDDDVRRSDVVEIEIGANDVGYSSSCGTSASCYLAQLPTVERNLRTIVARVRALHSGRKVVVVLLDYWNVWLGGRYEAAKGAAYANAADAVTDRLDRVIRVTAARTGSAYVDLRAAFKGPSYRYDETRYLASDGDHPNAAGHRRIASAAEAVIRRRLGLR